MFWLSARSPLNRLATLFRNGMPKKTRSKPDWASKVRELRESLHLKQPPFAAELGSTDQTVSNWETGRNQPSAEHYIKMGNMAPPELAVFFYRQAGVDMRSVEQAITTERARKSPTKKTPKN